MHAFSKSFFLRRKYSHEIELLRTFSKIIFYHSRYMNASLINHLSKITSMQAHNIRSFLTKKDPRVLCLHVLILCMLLVALVTVMAPL